MRSQKTQPLSPHLFTQDRCAVIPMGSQHARKRANGMEQLLNNSAMPMDADEAIDLTEDSPLPPQSTAKQNQEDQAHRRRIMAYAAAVNAQNGFNGSGTAKALAGVKRRREAPVPSSRPPPQQQQPEQIVILSDDEDDVGPGAAPKRQLLAHSTHSSAGHAHPSSHNAAPSHGLSVGPGRPGMPLQDSAAAQVAAVDSSNEQQQQQQASSGAALMAQLARERMEREQRRQQQQQQHGHALASSSSVRAATQLPEPTRRDVSVLTYNIW